MPAKKGQPNAGQFKKGYDPRRHELTTEDRRKGYRNATAWRSVKVKQFVRSRVAATARPGTVARFRKLWLGTPRCPA